jgi:U1 small nuclear ribonucleoprotein 70kDa
LAYYRPLDKDIDRITPKNVEGVTDFLARVREENTQGIIAAGREGMEEGEEPTFTFAEETKREIRREERRKKIEEEFRIAKEICW